MRANGYLGQNEYADDAAAKSSLLWWRLAGIGLLLVCILPRFWPTLRQVGMHVEDAVLFNYYYDHQRSLADIFHSHIGQRYLTVTADFMAWLYAWFDVRWQPRLYQWTGFAAAVCTASVFSFSGMIRDRALLLVTPLFIGLLGLNDLYYYNTLIYIMYTGVLLLLMLLLYPAPVTRAGFALQALLMLILPWSGPFSAFALPAALFLFFCTEVRAKRVLHAIAFCSTLAYCLTVTGSNLRLARIQKLWVVERYFSAMFDKIVLFDFFTNPALVFSLIGVALLALVLFVLRRDSEYWQPALVMLMYMFGSVSLFFLSIKLAQYISLKNCHIVTASFFWACLLILTMDRLLRRFGAKAFWSAACAMVLAGLLILDFFAHPVKWRIKMHPNGRQFFATVAHYEQQRLAEKKQSVCLMLPYLPGSMMTPRIVVGHRGPDGRRLSQDDPELTVGREFVCRR